MLRTLLPVVWLTGALCSSSCASVREGRGDHYFLRGILSVAGEVGFPEKEVRVDPRILRAGNELRVAEPGAIDSLPKKLVARRAAAVQSAGFLTGRIEETSRCSDFLGLSGLRLSPVPDSIQARVDACQEVSGRVHVIASRPETLGDTVKMVAVGLGDGQYVVWEILWPEPGGPPTIKETYRVISE